jgi:hypothetical protein
MKTKFIILLCFILCLRSTMLYSQDFDGIKNPVVFTDRDFCISGDTLWYKLWFPDFENTKENIGRIQLEAIEGNTISSVIVRVKEGWGQGYIFVPDSLGTAQYFITAYRNSQQNQQKLKLLSKSIFVYNRFDNALNQIKTADINSINKLDSNFKAIKIRTNKDTYSKREKVILDLDINSVMGFKKVLIRAALVDPLAKEYEGYYSFNIENSQNNFPVVEERNGFLWSGKAVDSFGNPQKDALVTLSIPNASNYFDYYLTGNKGDFHFFLANATGQTKSYLQTFSKKKKILNIEITQNSLNRDDATNILKKMLTPSQTNFIDKVIKGNYISRLFQASIPVKSILFEMPTPFQMPFYGPPKKHIVPAEFIDLNHFEEISKELLNGVRYRKSDDKISIRMVDEANNSMFKSEPLRLLNGIPVSNNLLIASLKSKDISYIDLTFKKRVFGGLTFNGVLDISLHDKSNKRIKKESNIFEFNLNCIQVDKPPLYLKNRSTDETRPDIRQTFLWETLNPENSHNIEFYLSDLKGKVEIMIEFITANNEIITTSKIIEVK